MGVFSSKNLVELAGVSLKVNFIFFYRLGIIKCKFIKATPGLSVDSDSNGEKFVLGCETLCSSVLNNVDAISGDLLCNWII